MEPERGRGVQPPVQRLNPTVLALIAGLIALLLLVAYFQSNRNPNQDKLSDGQLVQAEAPSKEKKCASKGTYDLIKRELFRRAGQMRGSDQAAFDRLSAYAVLRMENPVLESEDSATGALNCSGSLSLDLPPGVAVVGGRRTLAADLDYTVQPSADGSGDVVLLRNADAIIAPLATLARVAQPQQQPQLGNVVEPLPGARSDAMPAPGGMQPAPPAAPSPPAAAPEPPTSSARPSFNCANASTRGEIAVCRDPGLAALDRQMAAHFYSALGQAGPAERALLQRTRSRFLAYRDSCRSDACVADAYRGRMREISDIMAGRWRPPR
jgi:uncharacterized protein YecT (DUF1311 family)